MGSKPHPSSTTERRTTRGRNCKSTVTRFGRACFTALITASCPMRSKFSSMVAANRRGSPSTFTWMLVRSPLVIDSTVWARADTRSPSSSMRQRKSQTDRRASIMLRRLILRAISTACRAVCGVCWKQSAAKSNCMVIPASSCSSVSCSSRAIRSRSS